MEGTIFDIKEFSIHDGPGARVTVFLKGCPLRCLWCHNPEGLSVQRQLMHKKNLCTGCGRCMQGCDHEDCKPFGRCIHVCPQGAISVTGEVITADALAGKLLKNADFFAMTGGGITVSGGEPMLQSDFVIELTQKLGSIHKALQTSGYAQPETYGRVVEQFDFIMQDIKLVDGELHKRYTGVSNENILKNIEYLKNSGKQYVFRVPLIPGITDTESNLRAISKLVGDSPVELLKYNNLAGAKYEMLGKTYELDDVGIEERDQSQLLSLFQNAIWG